MMRFGEQKFSLYPRDNPRDSGRDNMENFLSIWITGITRGTYPHPLGIIITVLEPVLAGRIGTRRRVIHLSTPLIIISKYIYTFCTSKPHFFQSLWITHFLEHSTAGSNFDLKSASFRAMTGRPQIETSPHAAQNSLAETEAPPCEIAPRDAAATSVWSDGFHGSDPAAMLCPNCGSRLEGRKCKLFCLRPGCGYQVTCAEW